MADAIAERVEFVTKSHNQRTPKCVLLSTVRAVFDFGFTCTVAHDACASRDLAFNGLTIPAAQVHGSFLAALGTVYAQLM